MPRDSELTIAQPSIKFVPKPLRYYDPELQNAGSPEEWNEESYARFRRAKDEAKRLRRAYQKQLAKLRPRLSKRTYSLFADERQPLFDSNLLEFAFGDSISKLRTRGFRFATIVSAKFLGFDMKTIHLLRYRGINSLAINVPNERWYDWSDATAIDSLLANELIASSATLMEHRFLFSSGTTISIRFSEVRWDKRRLHGDSDE